MLAQLDLVDPTKLNELPRTNFHSQNKLTSPLKLSPLKKSTNVSVQRTISIPITFEFELTLLNFR